MTRTKRTSAIALLLAVLLLFSVAAPAAAADIPTPTGFSAKYTTYNGEPCIFCSWDRLDYTKWNSYSGYSIVYSTDQNNWSVAEISTDIYKIQTYITSFYEGGKPKKGTTYYLAMMYFGADGESVSNPSQVVSVKFGNTQTSTQPTTKPATQPTTKPAKDTALEKEWNQLKKNIDKAPVMKSKNYDCALKKGTIITYTTPLYKVTFTVTKIAKDAYGYLDQGSFKITLETNYGFKLATDATGAKFSKDKKTVTFTDYIYEDIYDTINFSVKDNGFIKYVTNRYKGKVSDFNSFQSHLNKMKDIPFEIEFIGTKGLVTNISKSNITSTYNSITITSSFGTFILYYRKSGDKKWQKINCNLSPMTGESKTIKKLAPNTVYELRTQASKELQTDDHEYRTFKGPISKTIKIRTGAKEKPVITSVKVTNVKKTIVHHKGHWVHNTAKPDEWKKAYDEKVTTFTVTIKIKALPKNAVGVYAGGKAQKGTTVTFTSSLAGHVNKVSRAVSVCTYMENRGTNQFGYSAVSGTSPSVKINVHN